MPRNLPIESLVKAINRQLNSNLVDPSSASILAVLSKLCSQDKRARKTYATIDGYSIELNAIFQLLPQGKASYPCFRDRIKQLISTSDLNLTLLVLAKKLSNQYWRLVCGSGRSKSFTYYGDLMPSFYGLSFSSIVHFLYVSGNMQKKSLVYGRLKKGWTLDDAISLKQNLSAAQTASVYSVTHLETGKIYVGVTTIGIEKRWQQHLNLASKAPNRIFYQYINSYGASAFTLELLESGILVQQCADREKYWIKKLSALAPNGLNSCFGGQAPAGRFKTYSVDNDTFSTIRAAAVAHVLKTNGECSEFVAARHISAGLTPPERSRKHSQAKFSGKPLYRIWLALKRRNRLSDEWLSYETFRLDVSGQSLTDEHPYPGYCLISKLGKGRLNSENFIWATKAEAAARIHSKPVILFGREFPSVTAVARFYKLAPSTLRYRVNIKGMTLEDAALGNT